MRGILFDNGVELQLETLQESWTQGDLIEGKVCLIAHSDAVQQSQQVQLKLVYSDIKKVQDQESMLILEEKIISCERQKDVSWSFQLDTNSPISDKKNSFFLIYGFVDGKSSQIDFLVSSHCLISTFLQTFQRTWDFVSKQQKFHQGKFQTKMLPPESKRFAKLDYINCFLCVKDEVFHVQYKFRIQKFGRESGKNELKIVRETKVHEQSLELEQCLYGGYPNRTVLKKMIEEAFEKNAPQGQEACF